MQLELRAMGVDAMEGGPRPQSGALGVMLMEVSFAYQRDWLEQREPDTAQSPPAARE